MGEGGRERDGTTCLLYLSVETTKTLSFLGLLMFNLMGINWPFCTKFAVVMAYWPTKCVAEFIQLVSSFGSFALLGISENNF